MVSVHYKKDEHSSQLRDWLLERSMPTELVEDMPKLGVIIEGRACGFLRECEGNSAIMDSYLTNPHASPEERNQALDLITTHLIVLAKARGFKRIIAFTEVSNIITRAEAHGFQPVDFKVLIHPL